MSKKKAADPAAESITMYKGFDADMKCRGYQYAVSETYEHKGAVKACVSGFHACEYPLDVFDYYAPANSRFAVVEQFGKLSKDGEDSKVASSKLTVRAEIGLPGIIQAAIEYTLARVTPAEGAATNSGDSGAATNSGDSGAATNSGYRGAATNSGYSGAATNSGDSGAATNSGDSGAATNSGYSGVAADFNGWGKARSCASGAIFLVNRDNEGNIRHVFASKVGENGIEPDKFYRLGDDGQPVEV